MNVPSPSGVAPESLLAEQDWARRLARRLVDEPALAEDLLQETWVRALEDPPRPGWPMRSWLGGVLRNLARQGRRERARREAREHASARAEALPGAGEALERLAVQQDVVRALLALDEPYRSTLVLRFYEDLPPRRIAAREGVPVATVKTRIARGLAQLRARLDREHGADGRSWALFLLPLAARGRGLVSLIAGAFAVSSLLKLGLAVAAAILVVWLAQRGGEHAVPELEAAHASEPVELAAPTPATIEPVALAQRESVVFLPAPSAPASAPPEEEAVRIAGIVIQVDGTPVGGVELGGRTSRGVRMDGDFSAVLWEEELDEDAPPLAFSASDGRFAFERPEGFNGAVVSQDERWETVRAPTMGLKASDDLVLVVAPRLRLTGRVIDEAGAPLSGVDLRFGLPESWQGPAGFTLAGSHTGSWGATSDARGHFAFERVPSVAQARLRVRLAPYETRILVQEAWVEEELEIVLSKPAGAYLAGLVEVGGLPAQGAVVALGYRATRTAADGSFQLSLAGLEREAELLAAATGFLPARFRGDPNEDGSVRWPDFVRLSLVAECLALEGTVVDAEGAPLAGQEVWIHDGTVAHVEEGGFPVLLESLLAGKPDMRLGTKTDEHGRFRITGLDAREYELRVIDEKTALLADAGPFAAGRSDVRIRQRTDQAWPLVRGVVLSRAGVPQPGVQISLWRDAGMTGAGTQYFGFLAYGARAETGADGAFELSDVPRGGIELHVLGPGLVDPELELDADLDPLALRVEVGVWRQLEVQVGSTHAGADSFAVFDARGEVVQISVPTGGGISRLYRQSLAGGRSPVVSVGDQAAEIVLYAENVELARFPITLQDGVNTLQL